MPPAASICIINEVPERGSPETIVITSPEILSFKLRLGTGFRPFALCLVRSTEMLVRIGQQTVRLFEFR